MADRMSAPPKPQPAALARLDRWLDNRLGLADVEPQAALLVLLFSLALVLSLWTMSQGWGNPLLDMHAFRQTQTAITVDSMLDHGPLLPYEIPVFGPPWSLPFELPVFQWLVAGLVRLLRTPIDQTGRLVCASFFYLSFIPIYTLLGSLRIRPAHRLVFLILLLASPLYLFWSRTFMIESLALFLCLAYLALIAAALDSRARRTMVAAAVCGSFGAAVKVTTFFGFLMAAGFLIALVGYKAWQARSLAATARRAVLPVVIAAIVPIVVSSLWTGYADAIKLLNPIGATLTSEALLAHWILGPLSLRTSPELWATILVRMLPDVLGYPYLLLLMLPMLSYAALRQPRLAGLALASALLFLVPILLFANLHLIHNYYQYAVGLFLLASAGFLIVAFLRTEGLAGWTGLLLLAMFAGIGLLRYRAVWLPVQRQDTRQGPIMETALAAHSVTAPDQTLVIVGFDWYPAFAYYSQRRALMLPGWLEWESPAFQQALANLGTDSIGAFMVCRGERDEPDEVADRLAELGRASMPSAGTDLCDIYLPEGDGSVAGGWH